MNGRMPGVVKAMRAALKETGSLKFFSGSALHLLSFAFVRASEKGVRWQQALGLWTVMPQSGLRPNVISHNAAFSTGEKGELWQQAPGLYCWGHLGLVHF
jgi:hypothetical protein